MNNAMIMDLHTHSIASGHAYSTVTENARAAKEHGLEIMGLSDHGYGMPATTMHDYWMNIHVLPDYLEGVRLLKGVELNLHNHQGAILEEDLFSEVDYAIVSLHGGLFDYESGSREDYTDAYLHCLERYPEINIIGHIDDGRYPVDYAAVIDACKAHNVALELNCSSLAPDSFRLHSEANARRYLSLCKEKKLPIIVNTDAHFSSYVGDFSYAVALLEELDFPEELIMNHSWQRLEKLLGRSL